MKNIIPAMLAVAISVVPLGASAGEPSAPSMAGAGPPGMCQKAKLTASQQQAARQLMEQTHQQFEQLHAQVRAKVLGTLNPAHRTLLAEVVGSLAVAANPDPDAAAKQLDAALSPAEAQAVLSIHSAAMSQVRSIMESTHQRFLSILTPQERAQMPSGPPMGDMHGPDMKEMSTLTAGQVLLHLAQFDSGEHDHIIMMQAAHPM